MSDPFLSIILHTAYLLEFLYSTEDIVDEFGKFGVIGDVYRPQSMGFYVVEKNLIFIRYFSASDAHNAQVRDYFPICFFT